MSAPERHVSHRCPNMERHGRGLAVPCGECTSIESFWRVIPYEPDSRTPLEQAAQLDGLLMEAALRQARRDKAGRAASCETVIMTDDEWNPDDDRPTLEACICGEHKDCPDGWHYGDDLPCSCTPDCALAEDDD